MDRFAALKAQARRNIEAERLREELDAQEAGAIAALGGPAKAAETLDALWEELQDAKAYSVDELVALLSGEARTKD